MPTPLYTSHSRALTVLYADLESHALGQRQAFEGTAGTVIERTNASGFRFYAHQSYDGDRRKREAYLAGPIGDAKADAAAEELRARIREMKDLVPSLRLLGREGFSLVDARVYATLASLHNHGVFAAGGMLVGSHAYGVLLNRLGVRAVPYMTEDIDVARGAALRFETPPEESFLDMLQIRASSSSPCRRSTARSRPRHSSSAAARRSTSICWRPPGTRPSRWSPCPS